MKDVKACLRGTKNIHGKCIPKEDIVKQRVTLTKMPGKNPWWQVQKEIYLVKSNEVVSIPKSDVVKKARASELKRKWLKEKDSRFKKWME